MSLGRLTLKILLSFAEFEREIISRTHAREGVDRAQEGQSASASAGCRCVRRTSHNKTAVSADMF
jgi:DNA invertase Pin-like site-specific DNA recombinase